VIEDHLIATVHPHAFAVCVLVPRRFIASPSARAAQIQYSTVREPSPRSCPVQGRVGHLPCLPTTSTKRDGRDRRSRWRYAFRLCRRDFTATSTSAFSAYRGPAGVIHSTPALAGVECFARSSVTVPPAEAHMRNAARSSYPTPPSGFTGGVLDAPHGHHARPGDASLRRRLRRSCGFPGGTLRVPHVVARPVVAPNSEREARAAGECRRGGAGAGIGRASARCLATERGGRSPPRVQTGGRTAAHPHPSRNCRDTPTGGRTAAIPTRQQIGRASRPGGRTAAHLNPMADRPSIPPRRQNPRASRPAPRPAALPSPP
jgi:hypothetical protein